MTRHSVPAVPERCPEVRHHKKSNVLFFLLFLFYATACDGVGLLDFLPVNCWRVRSFPESKSWHRGPPHGAKGDPHALQSRLDYLCPELRGKWPGAQSLKQAVTQ